MRVILCVSNPVASEMGRLQYLRLEIRFANALRSTDLSMLLQGLCHHAGAASPAKLHFWQSRGRWCEYWDLLAIPRPRVGPAGVVYSLNRRREKFLTVACSGEDSAAAELGGAA
jgi:hypothetical protein